MTVKEIFDTLDYGPAPESAAEAQDWIKAQGGSFGHFVGGKFTKPGKTFVTRNPATGKPLAKITQGTKADVTAAVKAARKAQKSWASDDHARARALYAIARLLQKHSRLFAVLETLDNGKPIRESRDIDVPLAIRHFYYHAGQAELMARQMQGREALGVCGQVVPWNFPLLMLAWKIAPALAMGNTVVLKPAEWTSLTALLFGQICIEAGLPAGVVNIVTGDGSTGHEIVMADVDKVAFTGSTAVGRAIRKATAGSGKALTLELGGKSPYIVFDDADIDSAIEGLVDAIWFNQGQVCCAGSRLLVQEGIADRFHAKLRARMDTLRMGDPLDKCIDVGAVVDPVQRDRIAAMVSANTEGEAYQANTPVPEGCFYPPTLITGLSTASPLMQEEIFGPVLVSTTFRTPSEAIEVANNTRYGLAASLWSENINLALGLAPKLAAGVVWINGTNMFDAAAPFGGIRESGFGREGGPEGLLAYSRPKAKGAALKPVAIHSGKAGAADPIDRTAKLYIGGKQSRPDGGYSKPVFGPKGASIGHASIANRKDLRNAVEAMNAAKGWAGTTPHLRAQILYYMAENLSARAQEFANRIDAMVGGTSGAADVDHAIRSLFASAAWADNYSGETRAVPLRGLALAVHEPVGKIVAFCPDDRPLSGLIALAAPAIALGNRITVVPSQAAPLAATDLIQVLETSDLPGGVLNILTGDHSDLAGHAASHNDIDAVWSHSHSDLSETIEAAAAGNLKRTWVNHGRANPLDIEDVLQAATETKSIWIPFGE